MISESTWAPTTPAAMRAPCRCTRVLDAGGARGVVPAAVPTRLAGVHHGLVALAVCVLFDAAGQRLIRSLWARLEDAGIGSLASHTHGHHHPHLSYAVLLEWDLDRVRDTLGRLPDGGVFPANVQGSVVFPRGRVALAVAVPRRGRTSPGPSHLGADGHRCAVAQALPPGVLDPARLSGDAGARSPAPGRDHRDLRRAPRHTDSRQCRAHRHRHRADLAPTRDPLRGTRGAASTPPSPRGAAVWTSGQGEGPGTATG